MPPSSRTRQQVIADLKKACFDTKAGFAAVPWLMVEEAFAEASRSETTPVSELKHRVKWSNENYPLHRPEIVSKAIKTANWMDDCARTQFFQPKPNLEDAEVYPGQALHLCRALESLTLDEVLDLYASIKATEEHDKRVERPRSTDGSVEGDSHEATD